MVDSSSDGTPTDLLIRNGKIAAHLAPGTPVDASIPVRSAQGLHLFPGLIDAHVHFGFGEKIMVKLTNANFQGATMPNGSVYS